MRPSDWNIAGTKPRIAGGCEREQLTPGHAAEPCEVAGRREPQQASLDAMAAAASPEITAGATTLAPGIPMGDPVGPGMREVWRRQQEIGNTREPGGPPTRVLQREDPRDLDIDGGTQPAGERRLGQAAIFRLDPMGATYTNPSDVAVQGSRELRRRRPSLDQTAAIPPGKKHGHRLGNTGPQPETPKRNRR